MKILNYGSLNIDHVYLVDHFVKTGETLSSDGYHQCCGGKGLNQSIALAYSGAQVYHAGKIGPDGQLLKYPVENRDDFEKIKQERLDPDTTSRFPSILLWLLEVYEERNFLLIVGGSLFGFYNILRMMIGFENLCYMLYSDIKLIRNILDHFLNFWITIYGRILPLIDPKPEAVYICEDMAFKNSPMVSPAMFKEVFSPYYKKLTGFLNSNGIKNIIVDSDGNIEELIPLFLDCGVTGITPFEIASGLDLLKIRKNYPDLQIFGGIDKRKLKNKELIDKELEKVEYMLNLGGYVPHVDHTVPPDVSWENFKYYRNRLNAIISEYGK
ncbi:MAG: hypothetical protein K8S14_01945 [Actinomycetia bacterium]|nr:hypothetical protein [Actinomycetes bacterium]